MKKNKSNLDERQEQTLLRIEHNGCWLAFWGLFAALIVQTILGFDFRNLAGESIVFLLLAFYLMAGCMKHGIWDRRLKPDTSSNVAVSLKGALVAGILGFVYTVRRFPDKIAGSVASGIVYAIMIFTICFVVLEVSAQLFKKKQSKLEEEHPENEKE